ncbi:hypothetical protein INR49_032262 [Caranx melampygus]|nr:hypothetical protein INR49_032262 [Caranx melampygus]
MAKDVLFGHGCQGREGVRRRAQAAKLRWRKSNQEQLPSQSSPPRQLRTMETQPPAPKLQLTTSLERHSQVHSSGDWMMCVPTFVHVFVVDFPLHLDCEVSYQDLLRQEYHRISARMGGGLLLSTEPSLVQQHSITCYGRSVSFSSVLPSGLPALSKAQEAGWITPIQTVLEFGGGPFQPDFCGSDVSPVRQPWTKGGHPSGSRPPVNNMARTKTPSPTAPSWTIADAGCNPPSPAKTAQSPIPSSSSWPWFISDAPSTSRSPANEWMTSVPTVKMQTKLLVPTSSIIKMITTDQEGRPPEDRS